MTLPWLPFPRAALASPRARMLSLEAVAVVALAWSLTDDTGVVPDAPDAPARESLEFVAAQHLAESDDPDRARQRAVDAVAEALRSGMLTEFPGGVRVRGWIQLEGAQVQPQAHGGRPGPAPGPVELSPGALKSDRHRWKHRLGKYASVPSDLSYEQARAWVAAKGSTGCTSVADGLHNGFQPVAQAVVAEVSLQPGATSRAVSETSRASANAGEERENQKKEEARTARVGRVAPVASKVAAAVSPRLQPKPRRVAPVAAELLPPDPLPFSAAAALEAVEAESAGRFVVPRGAEFEAVRRHIGKVTDLIRGIPDLERWRLVGRWLASGAMDWRKERGVGWLVTSEAFSLSRAWEAAQNDPSQSGVRDRPDPPPDALNPWDVARARHDALPATGGT